MSIISVLPDHIANQIAAGEVVQRPASVVKELLENSLDAGASKIQLDVLGAGKISISVIDNGQGMDERDAELCFMRHATSKIKHADDLFNLHTRGFRGEAMASIAAVAHVELRTQVADQPLGLALKLEDSKIVQKEPWPGQKGTQVDVKNLFYNVPARRKFLKSDKIELRHIIDEFQRVALVHHQTEWTFRHDSHILFQLKPENFRRRIAAVFGRKYDERLVPIQEETEVVKVEGFILKPEFAKKTRGEQFFFVNNRFIKSPFLHMAVREAFEDVLSGEHHPGYFLRLRVDPGTMDVNIHPTKTEVKFEDERAIYAVLRSAIRHAIGQFNVAPTLDFDRDDSFAPLGMPTGPVQPPTITVNPSYNPFDPEPHQTSGSAKSKYPTYEQSMDQKYLNTKTSTGVDALESEMREFWAASEAGAPDLRPKSPHVLLWGKHAITTLGSKALIIDLIPARYRVLYDQLWNKLKDSTVASQQLMFPISLHFSAGDTVLVQQYEQQLLETGFQLAPAKNPGEFDLHGIPVILSPEEGRPALEQFLEHVKNFETPPEPQALLQTLVKSICQSAARSHIPNQTEELSDLREKLLSSTNPQFAPNGKRIIYELTQEGLETLL